jgi:hypothetical protein
MHESFLVQRPPRDVRRHADRTVNTTPFSQKPGGHDSALLPALVQPVERIRCD